MTECRCMYVAMTVVRYGRVISEMVDTVSPVRDRVLDNTRSITQANVIRVSALTVTPRIMPPDSDPSTRRGLIPMA